MYAVLYINEDRIMDNKKTYLIEVMYYDSIKNANKINLEQRLHDKMMEQFKKDKEAYGKNPCR